MKFSLYLIGFICCLALSDATAVFSKIWENANSDLNSWKKLQNKFLGYEQNERLSTTNENPTCFTLNGEPYPCFKDDTSNIEEDDGNYLCFNLEHIPIPCVKDESSNVEEDQFLSVSVGGIGGNSNGGRTRKMRPRSKDNESNVAQFKNDELSNAEEDNAKYDSRTKDMTTSDNNNEIPVSFGAVATLSDDWDNVEEDHYNGRKRVKKHRKSGAPKKKDN